MAPAASPRFIKLFVIVNVLVPALLLAIDAAQGNVGANGVNYVIHTTGLLGLLCMVLSLVITPVIRSTGWRTLVAARRPLGVLSFCYLLAHFVIYVAFDRAGDIGSTVEEIVSRRYLQIGTGALVLMLPLALTSTDAMITRIGAKRWKLLHRLAYITAIGGVAHYWLLVKSDTRQPRAFAIALTALLVFRIVFHYIDLRSALAKARARKVSPAPKAGTAPAGLGLKKYWRGELRVARIFQETPTVKTFRLMMPDGGGLPFAYAPGQYLNIALTIDGKRVPRSYTIASSPTRGDAIEMTVRRAINGYASHFLHDHVREGDLLSISAPAGKFVFTGANETSVVLLAGGVGVTPLMGIVRYLTDRCWTGQIYLVFSVRTVSEVMFADELAALQTRFANLHVHVTVGDSAADDTIPSTWRGARGRISAAMLRELVPEIAAAPVFICGPGPMMDSMQTLAGELGVPAARIHVEAFVSPTAGAEPATDAVDAPIAATAVAAPRSAGAVYQIRFRKSDTDAASAVDESILEAAEACGVNIPYECRAGVCGQCKTKLVSGNVTMDTSDALTAADRAAGLILACQAHPTCDVTLDA